ncbi:MAG: hypothetical protein QNJ69_08360 [Gammaproteobacteria bacterium]|nr:hypothetical protein [Gammaproteobacteria bacterium]
MLTCSKFHAHILWLAIWFFPMGKTLAANVNFIWEGTFALDAKLTKNEDNKPGFRIATYLPPGTLVYDVKDANYRDYKLGVTQSGLALLIHHSAISAQPLVPFAGKNVLVHRNMHVCNSRACSSKTWISRGSVLKVELEADGYKAVRVSHFANNTREEELFFRLADYNSEVNKGFITEYDALQDNGPKYRVLSSTRINSLSTECAETKDEIDVTSLKADLESSLEPSGLIPWLSKWFKLSVNLAVGKEKTYTTSKVIGGADISVERRKIDVVKFDGDEEEPAVFYANIIYRCLKNSDIRVFIEQVQVKDKQGANKFVHGFDALHGTEISDQPLKRSHSIYQIYKKNGNRPFLTSINNHEYYEKIIEKFFEEIEDASLLRIFLKEFNVGCSSANRDDCSQIIDALTGS